MLQKSNYYCRRNKAHCTINRKSKMKKTIERKVTYNGIEFTADNYGNLKIDG